MYLKSSRTCNNQIRTQFNLWFAQRQKVLDPLAAMEMPYESVLGPDNAAKVMQLHLAHQKWI